MLADTHLRADLSGLPPEVWDEVESCDAVLHAGDVVTGDLLDALRARRPVHAVLGNNDHALVGELPDRLEVELAGVRVAMVHDSGRAPGGRAAFGAGFPTPESSCSATATSRSTSRARTASGCSTPARPSSAAASPGGRSACSSWRTAPSSDIASSR